MNWYLKCLSNYATFSGRARRTELWMYYLFNYIFALVIYFVSVILVAITAESAFLSILIIYILAVLVPGIAVTIRRLHDTGRSGWWYFISFIPFVGVIVLIVFLCEDGTAGKNIYGLDPKGRNGFRNNTYYGGNNNDSSGNDDYILN